MGLIYNLQQNELENDEREFLKKSEPYIEFMDLLKSIANFTDDTPYLVAKFLYCDGEILNLTAYDLEIKPMKGYIKTYGAYSLEKDDYIDIDVKYSEWFFRTFLGCETEKDYFNELEYDDYCYFKKTDILTLNCLKKIGFVDLSLLREYDEVERLKREILEKDEIVDRLGKNSSYQIQTDHASTISELHTRIAELEREITSKDECIAELQNQLANRSQNNTATTQPYFDNNNPYIYPPELDRAVKIWHEIYQTDNLPKHLTNHSDKFIQACKNLNFSVRENAMKKRLQQVTTPQIQKEKTKSKNSIN